MAANDMNQAQEKLKTAKQEIGKIIVGQTNLIDKMLISLLSDGHILLEGVPGVAKTLAANTFARILDCQFKRIQFTPDLLPADIVGTSIYNPKDSSFNVKKGPIFTNILLADEINRAPAKVQSALLEVMQEKQVTISGETFKAPSPFLVIATQNPIELEGTYPLAEAQTDRFMMKIKISYPTRKEEKEILHRMGTLTPPPPPKPIFNVEEIAAMRQLVEQIYVDDKVSEYILSVVIATRNPKDFGIPIEGLLEYGASPRASIFLKNSAKAAAFLEGRTFVSPQDIKNLAPDILRHRLRLTYEAQAKNLTTDDVIQKILNGIPVP